MKLMETAPAAAFEDAHLLGNGRLGASAFGGVPTERILINDDTLWSGQEGYTLNADHHPALLEARALALAGDDKRANDIINERMQGAWGEAYLPLGNLWITVGQRDNRRNMPLRRVLNLDEDPVSDYRRTLALDEAISRIEYARNGIRYTRELFVSHPRQLMALQLSAEGGALDFAMSLDSPLRHTILVEGGECALTGIAPDHAEPSYTTVKPELVYHGEAQSRAVRFAACARVAQTDGKVACDGTRVYVTGASFAVILLAAGTNYRGYQTERDPDAAHVLDAQRAILGGTDSYEAMRREHIGDHRALYDRVSLQLGAPVTESMPTAERLAMASGRVDDPSVAALALQYARYLLIAGSRPGSQALNLQGIWNDSTSAPWASNYTTNINLEMNYWPAEPLGLSECHEPLMDLIRESAHSGERTAKDYYRAPGWVAHHNIDLWRLTVPSCEDASWSWWPMAGAWLAQHLWAHYEYTQDGAFLREAYPVLRGAADFLLSQLVEHEGELVTSPSISPENKHIVTGRASYRELVQDVNPGNRFSPNSPAISAVTVGSTMDMTLARELFSNVVRAAEILGAEDDVQGRAAEALGKLARPRVGRTGALQEWREDYEECTPGMGHVSHLYGIFPGWVLNPTDFPEAHQGAQVSLERRVLHGGMGGGWPGAWGLCLAARLKQPLLCGQLVRGVLGHFSANMLTRGSVQIDSIFGLAAGVAEALLQNHDGCIDLLPSLPPTWREGSFSGFRARGGFRVDAAWAQGDLTTASIESLAGRRCSVRAPGLKALRHAGYEILTADGQIEFDTVVGERYELIFG